MNNYIYTLCDSQNVKIEKLHVCTWDLRGQKASLEIGLSITKTDIIPNNFDVYLFAPFIKKNSDINSLHRELSDAENFKFIFNEKHIGNENIGDDGRDGHIVRFFSNDGEKRMAIIRPSYELGNGFIKLHLTTYQGDYANLYCRILINTHFKTLAERVRGISKEIYKYDFKVNESRNIPTEIIDYRNHKNLFVSEVDSVYCLHCVPSDYELSYSDARKLISLRILELEAFERYITSLRDIEGEYIIVFQKDTLSGSYSFFTSFSRERIGNKQLTLAIATNLLCSFLFALSSWRNQGKVFSLSLANIPWEWWTALVLMIVCFFYCLSMQALIFEFIKKGCQKLAGWWKSR